MPITLISSISKGILGEIRRGILVKIFKEISVKKSYVKSKKKILEFHEEFCTFPILYKNYWKKKYIDISEEISVKIINGMEKF